MRKSKDRIPKEVLKEIFPRKIKRSLGSERVYSQLKHMILSGKLKKGRRLYREKIAQDFDVGCTAVSEAFSQLKRDGLVIVKHTVGSFVAWAQEKSLDLQIIPGLTCAYILSELVGMASIKRERVQFNKYSTSTCGLRGKILLEHTFLEL